MTRTRKGLLVLVLTYMAWGVLPLYYHLVAYVPSVEVLAHRTFWSFVLFTLYIAATGRLGELRALLHPSTGWSGLYKVALASVLISVNWFLYIDTVSIGKTLEAALGYYILPLIAVLVGLVLFGERLRGLQYPAVALAAVAVAVLAFELGEMPWRALGMGTSFALYGAVKKSFSADPILSTAAEVVLLSPLALLWIAGAEFGGWGATEARAAGLFGHDLGSSLLLILSGLLTGLPLLGFAYATQRVTMIAVGLGQYLNSTMQLLIAVFVFGEPFTHAHAIAMPLIWTGLVLYTVQAMREDRQTRAARRASRSSGTVSTVSK
ncbi:EamA family transporter RarD [Celeribacter indicus]|uniref:Protein RarD n=1 Tax=Celeribacter indicus TaxID=1208324 RepID=A0A0B5DV03_9RHOB|nr:EamA family transporter RarD [Celeribacter indicus]AJE47228.1 protein RarD [Celeribacter indicus]SDW01092.1 chloramphenicol-sensitive protein RarD [Celeribacter indicus]